MLYIIVVSEHNDVLKTQVNAKVFYKANNKTTKNYVKLAFNSYIPLVKLINSC